MLPSLLLSRFWICFVEHREHEMRFRWKFGLVVYIHVSVNIYGLSQFWFCVELSVLFLHNTAVQETSINHTINIRQPQDHRLFVLLFTIRWTMEMFFERSTSTCVIREFKIFTTWTATQTSQLMTFLCFLSKKLTAKLYKTTTNWSI